MKIGFFKTRFIAYILVLSILGGFLFNFLLTRQSNIMYKYFIEKPASYNLERAERLANSIYQSFKQEVPAPPTMTAVETFISKYNDIPFLSVNFIYRDKSGIMKSVLADVKEIDILSAEYVYPIRYGSQEVGTLLVYDINKEYKKGLEEYSQMLRLTRIFFTILLLSLSSILIYREYSAKIEHAKRIAEYQAVHDGLTGLYTQKYFKEHLEREVSRSQRYNRPLSLIMCDIDFFKQFNDTHGHLAGDEVLKNVSQMIQSNVRASDIVARYGGEEFAILLLEAGIEEARSVANRLRTITDEAIDVAGRIKDRVEHTPVNFDGKELNVTLSLGVASFNGAEKYKPEFLIADADHALYQSKENGRNQITLFDPENKNFTRVG